MPSAAKKLRGFSLKPESNVKLTCVLDDIENGLAAPPMNPKKTKEKKKDTAGKGWYDLPATPVTPELKTDLKLLQLRGVLDPKRHYKKTPKNEPLPKYFHVGTIVEGHSDFYSSRMTNKERKNTFVEELLANQEFKRSTKKRYLDLQKKKAGKPGVQKKYSKKMRSKERRTVKVS
eukprot:TRINITY_DN31733_c0_g1_i1.p1 TRINITY_DN31733_c0_g1~~TRINITY_DN31733_c0_g1_i1.p1  ORF type:complete len:175 (-),score=38.99 TRINITY_DN31733_c0_g1_i1:171-695(-)